MKTKKQYEIQVSQDGSQWRIAGGFAEEESSRFNEPFDDSIAVREATSFIDHWRADGCYKYVRLVSFVYVTETSFARSSLSVLLSEQVVGDIVRVCSACGKSSLVDRGIGKCPKCGLNNGLG